MNYMSYNMRKNSFLVEVTIKGNTNWNFYKKNLLLR